MRRRAAALFLAGVYLLPALAGTAAAETAPNLSDRQPVPLRIRDLARESGSAVVTNMGGSRPRNISGTTFKRTLATGGKYIRWGGGVLFAASLVNDALHWFYGQANASLNPTLDRWWLYKDFPSPGPGTHWSKTYQPDGEPVCRGYTSTNTPWTVFLGRNADGLYFPFIASYNTTTGAHQITSGGGDGYAPSTNRQRAFESATYNCRSLKPELSLAEIAQTDPAVSTAIGRAIGDYIEANPERARTAVEPAANDNQWADDPYANPSLDTDGDGYSDPDEYEDPEGDPNDPLKKPLGVPYETGRSTVTTTNPDGSTTTTTTISYSDGSKATTKVTRRTTSSTNPDGSITTTTTTTTTTTDREGRTTSRTHTDTKTSPAPAPGPKPDPGPDPDPEGDHDKDGTPNKDDPDRIRERQQQAEEEAKRKAEEEAKRKAEEEAKKKEEEEAKKKEEEEAAKKKKEEELAKKKEKCEAAERVWDDVNDTCGGEKPKDKDGDGVDNDCGDFSLPRLLKHTGAYLNDVVFPCEKPEDILKPVLDTLQHKFPFSLAASLNGWFDGASSAAGGGSSSTLPATLGIIPLDWGWLTPLWVIIKNVVGIALWVWFIYWLVDRFAPRTQI